MSLCDSDIFILVAYALFTVLHRTTNSISSSQWSDAAVFITYCSQNATLRRLNSINGQEDRRLFHATTFTTGAIIRDYSRTKKNSPPYNDETQAFG